MTSRVTEAIAGLTVVVFGLLLVEIGGIGILFGFGLGIGGVAGVLMAALLPDREPRTGSALERSVG